MIGGGITGLSAAHRLTELARENNQNIEILLLEQSNKLGGNISTVEKDGFLIEEGPDSFITTKPWALNLSRRLGLEGQIIETNEEKRRTFILHKDKLVALPDGFMMLAPTQILPFLKTPLFTWRGKLRMLLDLFIRKKQPGDESLASFVRRRLGTEALERVAQPMISGVYTADPENLSLRATMPQFLEMEEKYGSVIKGMYDSYRNRGKNNKSVSGARYSLFVSFRKGMNTLVDALKKRLPEESVKLEQQVVNIEAEDEGWRVETRDAAYHSSGIIFTTPAHVTAKLLQNVDESCASLLSEIEYASSLVVIFAYRKEDISNKLDAFGFVVPRVENRSIIACSYSSEKFTNRAPEGYTVLRAFVGGAVNPEKYQLGDREIVSAVEAELSQLLGIRSKPVFTILKRYPESMPQYAVGHLELIERISTEIGRHKGLELAGNAYGGVGIPDCVHSAEEAARRLLQSI